MAMALAQLVPLLALVPLVLALALAVAAALSCVRFGTWRRKGVPSPPRPLPLFGHCLRLVLQREPLHVTLDRFYRQFPDQPLVGFYAGASPVLLVKSLDLIKDITVKNFHVFPNHKLSPEPHYDKLFSKFLFCLADEEWKSTRVKMTPAFSSGRLKAMYTNVHAVSKLFVQSIRNNMDQNGDLAVNDMCSRYGIDVIASTAFGCEAGALRDREPPPFMRAVSAAFRFGRAEGISSLALLFSPLLYHTLRLPLLQEWRAEVLRGLLRQASEHRERQPTANKDIFDTLLQLKRSGDVPYEVFEAQVFAMQVAGSETSATTLMFALWLLARNPDRQQRLRDELRTAVEHADADGQIPFEAVHDLRYLDMVFKETLRLWPVMPWMDRVASEDFEFPGTGVKIEKGTVVFMPCYSIQRDPMYFEDPDAFVPERFDTDNASSNDKTAWLPFGSGPRACIGRRFADMSVKSALAHVISNYRVSMTKDTPRSDNELPINPMSFIITPTIELPLRFETL